MPHHSTEAQDRTPFCLKIDSVRLITTMLHHSAALSVSRTPVRKGLAVIAWHLLEKRKIDTEENRI